LSEDGFAGSWFWLSGASSGLGYAVAEALADRGASLILSSRTAGAMGERVKALETRGAAHVETLDLDITDPAAGARAKKHLGGRTLRGLLVNGGGARSGKTTSLAHEDFVKANEILLAGPASFMLALVPSMETPGGSVVAITSAAVREPVGELNLSAIYRSGLVVLLKNLARELAPVGVRVNNVAPGFTATDHVMDLAEKAAHAQSRATTDVTREWASGSAMGRMGEPEEIAHVVRFLFSREASFVTGQTILADGCSTRSYI
jgi:3-oxoacyl-[acyl-carrier protein] reductase